MSKNHVKTFKDLVPGKLYGFRYVGPPSVAARVPGLSFESAESFPGYYCGVTVPITSMILCIGVDDRMATFPFHSSDLSYIPLKFLLPDGQPVKITWWTLWEQLEKFGLRMFKVTKGWISKGNNKERVFRFPSESGILEA